MIKNFTAEIFLQQYIQLSDQSMEPGYNENCCKTIEAYHFNLAKAYMEGGQPRLALPLLKKLYADHPGTSRYAFHLVCCYQSLTVLSNAQIPVDKAATPRVAIEWLAAVERVFTAHLSDNRLSISFAASMLHLSERQFHRRIKQLTGQAPNQYLQEIRLKRANDLLVEGRLTTVKEVASAVGFKDVSYFSSLFVKHFGTRPSEVCR